MAFTPLRWIGTGFKYLWNALDFSRRVFFNLLILAILIMIIVNILSSGVKKIENKTALILNIKGTLVEQHDSNPREALLAEARGEAKKTTQLRDVLAVLDQAAKDPQISSAVLMLDEMDGAGLATLREVATAIDRFKASGKTVVAWGSSYDQRQYYLASRANEVYLHPMGTVMITGFGKYRNYYRDALDKLGVTVNVLKAGNFKSFGEPYVANGPSKEAAEAESYLFNGLWKTYTTDVEKARKLPEGDIMRGINDLSKLLVAAGGDIAKLSLNAKLVDGLKTRDELREIMLKRGIKDEQIKSFRQIPFDDYLARVKTKAFGDAVGVIVAAGEISEGMAPPGSIGGLSTAQMIRKAREDDSIKALVLRVDSPGGSAFGSELIRRELELTRKAGKPVVVSMGDVAASGGYWISMAADEVIADEATITGSIGVIAILPSADKAADKLGVHTAGSPTTWLADPFNPLRPFNARFAQVLQSSIDHTYADFTSKVAAARKTTPEKINEVAQGRVWTGIQAKERGLVDTIGNFGDALKSASTRAKLGADYRISYIEREPSKIDRILSIFDATAARVLHDNFKLAVVPTGMPPAAASQVLKDLSWLAEVNKEGKGFTALTHCLCTAP